MAGAAARLTRLSYLEREECECEGYEKQSPDGRNFVIRVDACVKVPKDWVAIIHQAERTGNIHGGDDRDEDRDG
jgi:hypothetical protein